MFITRFVRQDHKPEEEYYYHSLEEAIGHLELFADDESGLYERIEVISENEPDKPLNVLLFDKLTIVKTRKK